MKDKEFEGVITLLADKAKLAEYNDLAIVLYTYLGSRKHGVSSDFARHCKGFAKKGVKAIDMHSNIKNN
jgi:hypothetical protein|tara:strand:+ start:950 stop:1156 length:207 start_codon:yes stop_codon:yes gene_type:complete